MRLRPPRIGISSCLLGAEVRWDGGHKRDHTLIETLAPFVEWVAVCPELELGMGVPREPVHLEQAADGVRMLGNQSGKNWTQPMRAFSARRLSELALLELSGYVLKRDSPSCGVNGVELLVRGDPLRAGRGLFAAALVERFPSLPIAEEHQLHDPVVRERWLERVAAYRRPETA